MLQSVVFRAIVLALFGAPACAYGQPSDCALVSPANSAQMKALIEKYGGEDFRNPLSVRPNSEASKYDLVVHYARNRIVGCDVYLRSYNGKVVGDTIRARPGDTLHLRLVNALPMVPDGSHKHPQDPVPSGHHHFNFNITNLHTHGLHTAPQGPVESGQAKARFESDNVLIEVQPGDQQEYRIHIHDKHPSGTFWYHAHVHGSTAVQLASGMAGALIIEGGTAENGDLDVVPEIATIKENEKIFVLQQFGHDTNGSLETISSFRARPTLINGQLVPKIRMKPGEVQRWRFIHAGTEENVALALDGHPLHEVAADGISFGRVVSWPQTSEADQGPIDSKMVLAPGYRTDVLVRAELEPGQSSRRVFLRDLRLPNNVSLRTAESLNLRTMGATAEALGIPIDLADKPEQVLAEIIIEGDPIDLQLPTSGALANVKPVELNPIGTDELQRPQAQTVTLQIARKLICQGDGYCTPCTTTDLPAECGKLRYLVDGRQFSEENVRKLKLDTVAEWTLKGLGAEISPGQERPERHPFHIHVNPFFYERREPGGARNWVWKDTLLVPVPGSPGEPEKLRMRYTKFTGKFVIHCHILKHEDRGMMQLVEILP